VVFYYFY